MKLSNQKKPVKSIIKELRSLHRKKDFVGLEQASRKYLDYYENNPEIQNFLGAALSGQGLYQDSFVYFFKAVDIEFTIRNSMKGFLFCTLGFYIYALIIYMDKKIALINKN